jgi:hypothetical protein
VNPYQALFQAFADVGLRYLVVGGVAVNLHGFPRFTGDIDILLALDEENLVRMTTLMHQRGYVERLPIDLAQFARPEKVRRWLRDKNVRAYTFQSDTQPALDVDVLVAESLAFDGLERRKTLIEAWAIPIPVASIDDLIAMKRLAARPHDVQDIEALLELKGL